MTEEQPNTPLEAEDGADIQEQNDVAEDRNELETAREREDNIEHPVELGMEEERQENDDSEQEDDVDDEDSTDEDAAIMMLEGADRIHANELRRMRRFISLQHRAREAEDGLEAEDGIDIQEQNDVAEDGNELETAREREDNIEHPVELGMEEERQENDDSEREDDVEDEDSTDEYAAIMMLEGADRIHANELRRMRRFISLQHRAREAEYGLEAEEGIDIQEQNDVAEDGNELETAREREDNIEHPVELGMEEERQENDDSEQEDDVGDEDSTDTDAEEEIRMLEGGNGNRGNWHVNWLRRTRRRMLLFALHGPHRARGGGPDWSDDNDYMATAKRPENITFDQSLPTSHAYLGEMNDCSGIPYMEQETFVVLPILRVPDFILVPGQTMPLNVTHPREVSLMRYVMSREDKTFGVVMLSNQYDSEAPKTIDLGCTAELRSMRNEEVDEISAMVGIAIGRQRFNIMEERRQPDGNLMAKVQILSDDELPPPAFGARLGIHHKLHLLPVKTAKGTRRTLRSRNQAQAAWLTAWPPWVYKMFDVRELREDLIKELKNWNQDLNEKSLPSSPSEFSYWVASHLLMTNSMRLYLLKIDNSIQRLRCELDIIRKCAVYACKDCGEEIADRRDVFSMSYGGPMAAYVNPSGHIHETLTVYKSSGLIHMTRPSTEHSWFPGYAWSICECTSCGRHMGWKFTATNNELIPRKFWGLTRSGLCPKMRQDPSNDMAEQNPDTARRRRLTSTSSTTSSSSSSSLNWNLGGPML